MPVKRRGEQELYESIASFRVGAIRRWLGLTGEQIQTIMHINDNTETFGPVIEYLEDILKKERQL